MRRACRHWLETAARGDLSRAARMERLLRLLQHDDYGAREELLRRADVLLDEQGLRELAGRYEQQLTQLMAVAARTGQLPTEVFQVSGSLSLLSAALRWLDGSWGRNEGSRQHLLADALERLGRKVAFWSRVGPG